MVQGQMGRFVADHPARAARRDDRQRPRSRETRVRGDDDDEEDRHSRDRGGGARRRRRGCLTQKRSEEHTSELQSLMSISYAVFSLKKKTTKTVQTRTTK